MASVADLVPKNINVSQAEADVLLELAYLVTAVDGKLTDDELAAFGELAKRLHGAASSSTDDYLERFVDSIGWDRISARVKSIAAKLRPDLHDVAYTLALGLAFVDRDPHENEDRLHGVLGDALGLSPDRRETLSRKVGLDGGRSSG